MNTDTNTNTCRVIRYLLFAICYLLNKFANKKTLKMNKSNLNENRVKSRKKEMEKQRVD